MIQLSKYCINYLMGCNPSIWRYIYVEIFTMIEYLPHHAPKGRAIHPPLERWGLSSPLTVTGVLAVTNANTLDDTNDSDCRHTQK